MHRQTVRLAVALGVTAFATTTTWAAENYPNRSIRMVVPFSAGGPTDVAGRLLAQHLSEIWGKTVLIDNRPGAGSIIGTELVIQASPDGHTILLSTNSTFAVNPSVFRKLPYDVFRDLQLIGITGYAPHLLVVRSTIPAASLVELVALAKKQQGKLTYASSGLGTIIQMAGELFKYRAGIELSHVPFKGGAPATVAMLAGEVDMMMNDLSQFLVHMRGGKLRALAVANTKRLALTPEVPTFAEAGLAGVESGTWFGVAVTVQTPKPVVRSISAALGTVLARPEYWERMSTFGMEPLTLTPDQTAAYVRKEIDKWTQVAKAANVRLD